MGLRSIRLVCSKTFNLFLSCVSCKTHDGCSLVLGQKDKHTKYGFLTLLAAKSQWESECKKVLQVADNGPVLLTHNVGDRLLRAARALAAHIWVIIVAVPDRQIERVGV